MLDTYGQIKVAKVRLRSGSVYTLRLTDLNVFLRHITRTSESHDIRSLRCFTLLTSPLNSRCAFEACRFFDIVRILGPSFSSSKPNPH